MKEDGNAEAKTSVGQPLELSILERLVLTQLFPERANLVTQYIVSDLAERVKISREERDLINLRSGGRGVVWDEEKDPGPRTFLFSASEVQFLKDQAERLDRTQAVTVEMVGIITKIKALQ